MIRLGPTPQDTINESGFVDDSIAAMKGTETQDLEVLTVRSRWLILAVTDVIMGLRGSNMV